MYVYVHTNVFVCVCARVCECECACMCVCVSLYISGRCVVETKIHSSMNMPSRPSQGAHLVHAGHARNVPFADVAVERRPCGTRCRGAHCGIEQAHHARHRYRVPVRHRTVRRCRGRRIGQPSYRSGAGVCIGDGRLRSGMRGQHEEQSEAGETV